MASPRILIADDEEVFAKNTTKLLSHRGYNAFYVTNANTAILALEKTDFDIVILDLRLPGMDGLSIFKEIVKLKFTTKALILAIHGYVDDALEAIRLLYWIGRRLPITYFRQPPTSINKILFNLLFLLVVDTCPSLALFLSDTPTATIFFVCHFYHLLSPLHRSLTTANTSIGKIFWQKVQLDFFFGLFDYLPLESRSCIK